MHECEIEFSDKNKKTFKAILDFCASTDIEEILLMELAIISKSQILMDSDLKPKIKENLSRSLENYIKNSVFSSKLCQNLPYPLISSAKPIKSIKLVSKALKLASSYRILCFLYPERPSRMDFISSLLTNYIKVLFDSKESTHWILEIFYE